jgi:hypothetical protein
VEVVSFPAPPKDYLPEDGRGGILVSKMEYQFVRVLFLNNSKIVWIEYLVSNPDTGKKIGSKLYNVSYMNYA